MQEEKYITIPYKVWVEKYQKLEEENKSLKLKNIGVFLLFRSIDTSAGANIGYIDIKAGSFTIDNPNISYAIEKALKHSVINEIRSLPIFSKVITTKEEACEINNNIKNMILLYQDLYKKNLQLYNKIPKIIRWLFKIKIGI